jgi:3-deoxy-manno-octulosonate cytidylyltransferase (CMP-KDO synthetase)
VAAASVTPPDPPAVLVVVPARHASTRFPAKLLAAETGRPLIQHTWERASATGLDARVLIATDDERIAEVARGFGAEVVMTAREHPNGTSRIAEVVRGLGADCPPVVVNVQGDEPELDPAGIEAAVRLLHEHEDCVVGTLACPIERDEDLADPAVVKLVRDARGRALYFSRAAIPHDRDGTAAAGPLRHIGLYVYRPAFLLEYVDLAPTPLERTEQLEQLRVLEHGFRIAVGVVPADRHAHGIDTPEQYAAFVARWRRVAGGSAAGDAPGIG